MAEHRTRDTLRSQGVCPKIGGYVALLFSASLLFSSLGYSQERRGSALPDGEGKQIVAFSCSQCHGLKEIEIVHDGQNGWKDTVDRMVLYGAQLSPSQADLVTRYLTAQFGPSNGTPRANDVTPGRGLAQGGAVPTQSASGNPAKKITLPAGPGRELVATRCSQCHDLEKVVSTTRSNADWVSVTNNMVQRGMKATPAEIQTIVVYLQANFGNASSGVITQYSGEAPGAPDPK